MSAATGARELKGARKERKGKGKKGKEEQDEEEMRLKEKRLREEEREQRGWRRQMRSSERHTQEPRLLLQLETRCEREREREKRRNDAPQLLPRDCFLIL